MKKLKVILMFIIIPFFVFAQKRGTQSVNFSVGQLTSHELRDVLDVIVTNLFSNITYKDGSVTPSFNLTYKYAVLDNWFVTGNGTYQFMKRDVYERDSKIGNVSHQFITVGVGTDYQYVNTSWFQMYSGFSIAYALQQSNFNTSGDIPNKTKHNFDFQINAVGLRFGKALAGIIELGYGYKGIATVGIAYQF